jgi:hypothetical protein
LRGIYELLVALIAFCGITQMYLLQVNVSPSIMLVVYSIIIVAFLEGIVFRKGTDQEPKDAHKRIAWMLILIFANVITFAMIGVEGSVLSSLGAGFLIVFFNFEQLGASLVFKYDNRRQTHETAER